MTRREHIERMRDYAMRFRTVGAEVDARWCDRCADSWEAMADAEDKFTAELLASADAR